MRKYPVGMVPGGSYFWDDTSTHAQGTHGIYWSNSAYISSGKAYNLYMRGGSNTVYPAYGYAKILGYTLRCLGNTTGEFQSLYNQYPTYDQMRKYPVGMVLGGRYYWGDDTLNFQSTRGVYWSSSVQTIDRTYALNLIDPNNTVDPATNGNRCFGFTLRCLGNTTGEFQSLYNQYPTYDQMRKYPVGLVLGGYYVWSGGTSDRQGERGYYWSSSTSNSVTNAYRLDLRGTGSTVYPAYGSNRCAGFTLRCLGKKINRYQKTLEKIVEVSYNYIITTPD